jgi:hypothetical protein
MIVGIFIVVAILIAVVIIGIIIAIIVVVIVVVIIGMIIVVIVVVIVVVVVIATMPFRPAPASEVRDVMVWRDHRASAEADHINMTEGVDDVLQYVGGKVYSCVLLIHVFSHSFLPSLWHSFAGFA